MKKVLIGGFLSLVGTIWELAIIIFVGNNMASSWVTPPGQFCTTVIETGMVIPMLIGLIFLVCGVLIMGIEYFKKEK